LSQVPETLGLDDVRLLAPNGNKTLEFEDVNQLTRIQIGI